MASSAENILQNLFGISSLEEASAEQLQQIINQHPYYGAAYFLLAKKIYLSKQNGYEETLQKAALHFANPLWLNFILNEEEAETAIETETSFQTNKEIKTEENLPAENSTVEN